ncbi:MAG: O-succinylhomoserine sulfhydrylase [Rhodobiaceae bacterium]|nr:O-succinylhomoserine sulfhydrylase [Rhodobiaceae bacterium]
MTLIPPVDPDWTLDTALVHGGTLRSQFGETSEAIYANSGFVYTSAEQAEARFKDEDEGFIYSRFSNPTVAMFEARMAALEGAEDARATASGMAAVHAALISQVKAGDHVVASRALFGSCRWVIEQLMPRYGIASTLVDGGDLDEWKAAIRPETKLLFLESPTNPALSIIDIAGVAAIAKDAGARLVVDNVFATPLGQKPLELGADVVVYSTTKHIDGQGRCLGGIILASKAFIDEYVHDYLRHTGPAMSPFNAWVMLKGLETLTLRVPHQCNTAAAVADALAQREKITKVIFPGRADHPQADIAAKQMALPGSLVGFEVAGGKEGAFRFSNALKLIRISNNLGDSKSLLTHPATTTHHRLHAREKEKLGITPGFVRLSIGLESATDLIRDIDQALAAV